jgi:hypothetical protein
MKGFAIEWSAAHTAGSRETTYAVGSGEKRQIRNQILETYEGSSIDDIREIPLRRARWITERSSSSGRADSASGSSAGASQVAGRTATRRGE